MYNALALASFPLSALPFLRACNDIIVPYKNATLAS